MKLWGEEGPPEGEDGSAPGDSVRRLPARTDPHQLVTAPIIMSPAAEPQVALNVLHYWNILVKWSWLIAALSGLGIAAGVTSTLLTTPIYKATTTIQIDMEPNKVTADQQNNTQAFDYDDPEKFYLTQYELLKSRALAERVVQNEGLASDPAFLNQGSSLPSVTGAPPSLTVSNRIRNSAHAASLVLSGLGVEPVRTSRLVKVSYESPNPAIAARIANAVAANFITWNLERRYEASAAARRFLEDRLQQTRDALEASQRRGNDYAQQNKLITIGGDQTSLDGKTSTTGESIAAADLAQVDQSLSAATAARIQAEEHWRQAQSTPDNALPEALADPSVQSLRTARDAAAADYRQNLSTYRPDFPTMVAAKAKINTLDQQITAQVAAIRGSLATQYQVARRNESELQAEVERRKTDLLASQGKRVEQGFINTDINTSQTLYDSMLATYKQIGISGAIEDNNISFVDRALTPHSPIKPEPMFNLFLFGFGGLASGILLAFLMEQFDLSIKLPEQIEKEFQLPVLATIPILRTNVSTAKALANPKSQLSEGYYSARAALQLSTAEGVPSSLLVTSSMMGEGKSTSALALAAGFGRLGMRVLLIDADMRSPSQHRFLSRDNSVGLSNLLSGGKNAHPAIQPTGYDNLRFLAAGPLPPNPSELLAGAKMAALLEGMKGHFDIVVVDSPPVMGLADAPQLASIVEGVLVVIEANATKRDVATAAIRRLRATHAHMLGVLFTKFDIKKAGYAYGYAYSYGYGRGYGYEYGVNQNARPLPFGALGRMLGLRRAA